MLVQSLVLIAAMVLLSGAILTSTLVTAKAALHHSVLAKTRAAMEDATSMFLTSTANNVAATGASPSKPWPAPTPIFESLCGEAASASPLPPSKCSLLARITWHVTGMTTASTSNASGPAIGTSDADNLAVTVNEQRLSGTITVHVTDRIGTPYAQSARRVTARVFDAKPYVLITALKDVNTMTGEVNATEGDSGGTPPLAITNRNFNTPNPQLPARYTDTRLITSLNCSNSSDVSQNDPTSATDAAKSLDRTVRPYGNQDWAFESPCAPSYNVDDSVAPSGYATPVGDVYIANPQAGKRLWRKRDQDSSNFAQ